MKDYWFVWSNDFEPIRIFHENRQITSALHRRHWKHVDVTNPYTNGENRVEAFFFPITHTPMIRKAELDIDFYLLAKFVATNKIDNYDIVDEPIPQYFKSTGMKDQHFPSVAYQGWAPLE